jgi:hypothetical protein
MTSVRAIGMAAWWAACAGVVLAPIHALARFETVDGASDLESGVVRAWAEPAARLLRPILDWSDPHTVYVAYGRVWLFLFLPTVLTAVVVWRSRASRGVERVGWWLALPGYALMLLSLVGDYWTPWMDQSFAFVGLPGTFLGMAGSIVLGVGLVRRRFTPAATGWLLIAWLPLFLLLSSVVAMGAGMLPLLFAWGVTGRRLASGMAPVPAGYSGSTPSEST